MGVANSNFPDDAAGEDGEHRVANSFAGSGAPNYRFPLSIRQFLSGLLPIISPMLLRSSLRLRLAISSLTLALLAAAPAAVAADSSASAEVPIVSTDESVQKELLNLDRLLDTNPKLEEALRTNVDKLTQDTFRAQNPEVDALLKKQPGLVRALKTEQHFFVHRYVARYARAKVTRKDAIELDDFLTKHADIAKALQKKPSQIVEANFLIANPPLAKFFEAHPALSSVLLQRDAKKQKTDAQKK